MHRYPSIFSHFRAVFLPIFLFLVGAVLTLTPAVHAQEFGAALAIADDQIIASDLGSGASAGQVYVFSRGVDGSWASTDVLSLAGPDADADGYGQALAADGATLVVGAGLRGLVDIHTRGADGSWTRVQRLAEEAAGFGRAVSLDDHMLIVGAENGAFGYHRGQDGVWVPVPGLDAGVFADNADHGAAVSVEGTRALVGAPGANDGNGEVHGYYFQDGAWHASGRLDLPAAGEGTAFGTSVLVHHGFALAGAPGYDRRIGAVGVYAWDEETTSYSFSTRLTLPAASGNERLGAWLAYSEHVVYVGAPMTNRAEGAVHAFRAENHMQTWMVQVPLPVDLQVRNGLGSRLAVQGDLLVASAPMYDNGEGAVVVYEKGDDGSWMQSSVVYPDEGAAYASITGSEMPCEDGSAGGWTCQDVDMISFLSVSDIGGVRGTRTNDIWGWTDPETGREYALVGRTDGMAFVDVTDPTMPVYLGNMDRTPGAPPSVWRDMKVYRDHVFVVADGAGEHGMQVFDLSRLRNVENAPVEFEPDVLYDGIASSHNIVINEETGFAYAVGNRMGGETCGGGLHMIDISSPKVPVFAGCFAHEGTGRSGTGTTHDAQCVVYRGPDSDHAGKEICLGSNETALSIADVTDKKDPTVISMATYPAIAYTHQGWLTEDQRFFFINDEGDEPQGLVDGTRTLIFDLVDLDDPVLVGEHISTEKNTDHNLYVRGNTMYQSNYQSGLRIFDITDPESPQEIAYFDTVRNDATGGGSWSNYPYFESGTIVVTSGREGLFMLRKKEVDL
ncbi:MAG: hypothetical protein COV99_03000 [Bacteroidetes bacterium CG12_big_fil_rev_8_21_14_0_65_60_17]|nr:MAG: hypothetical protein COV99_03000 [Bacteroidetes bacterium CG12_big_fil_rev_8_21_14_0_65_60_17]